MATTIRPEISENNKYWISKHRYYELKHFCLQYPIWKKAYLLLDNTALNAIKFNEIQENNTVGDPTAMRAIRKAYYKEKICLIEDVAKEADQYLYSYILKAVTEELSYNYLRLKLEIPCGREMYYDRYRKFFWLLSDRRD